MKNKNISIISIIISIAIANPSLAEKMIPVTIKSCHDGDTCITANGDKLRFACTDAPEIDQPYGIAARDHLRSLIKGKEIAIVPVERDRYGRIVATIYFKQNARWLLVQSQQVRTGSVWASAKYRTSCPDWNSIEADFNRARTQRLGLFKSNNPVPPWEWRKPKRSEIIKRHQ